MWGLNGSFLTSVSLVVAARKVMRGEVNTLGVLTAEKAFEPLPFLEEVAVLMPDLLPDGEIFNETFVWMA